MCKAEVQNIRMIRLVSDTGTGTNMNIAIKDVRIARILIPPDTNMDVPRPN